MINTFNKSNGWRGSAYNAARCLLASLTDWFGFRGTKVQFPFTPSPATSCWFEPTWNLNSVCSHGCLVEEYGTKVSKKFWNIRNVTRPCREQINYFSFMPICSILPGSHMVLAPSLHLENVYWNTLPVTGRPWLCLFLSFSVFVLVNKKIKNTRTSLVVTKNKRRITFRHHLQFVLLRCDNAMKGLHFEFFVLALLRVTEAAADYSWYQRRLRGKAERSSGLCLSWRKCLVIEAKGQRKGSSFSQEGVKYSQEVDKCQR